MNAWRSDGEQLVKDLNGIRSEVRRNQIICSQISGLERARAGIHSFYPHTSPSDRFTDLSCAKNAESIQGRGQHPRQLWNRPRSLYLLNTAPNRSLLCSETFHDSPQPLDKSQFHNLLSASFSRLFFSYILTGNSK